MMRTQPAITRPWFGAWPPEPYREPTAEMDDEKSTSDRTVQLVLALMALAGLAIHGGLYAAHDVIDHAHPLVRGAAHMVEYVAHGLVVAAILGIVVDHFLKQKLQEEVFKATLGYLLPPALRSAMEWMYSQQVICTYCRVNVTLRPLDDQSAVWVDVEITRRLQNASGNDAAVPMYFEIDNDVEVEIRRFTARLRSDTRWESKELRTDFTVRKELEPYRMSPREIITTEVDWSAKRPVNGDHSEVWLRATVDPVVTITAPEDFIVKVDASTTHGDMTCRPTGPGQTEWSMPEGGVLLPGQALVVKWRLQPSAAR
ncbi:MAG TPA: hypothetical protein VFH48_12020 [Chloroflexota bacterium]|nr:hypothetical protein [Chloroflexota bacterium]